MLLCIKSTYWAVIISLHQVPYKCCFVIPYSAVPWASKHVSMLFCYVINFFESFIHLKLTQEAHIYTDTCMVK